MLVCAFFWHFRQVVSKLRHRVLLDFSHYKGVPAYKSGRIVIFTPFRLLKLLFTGSVSHVPDLDLPAKLVELVSYSEP